LTWLHGRFGGCLTWLHGRCGDCWAWLHVRFCGHLAWLHNRSGGHPVTAWQLWWSFGMTAWHSILLVPSYSHNERPCPLSPPMCSHSNLTCDYMAHLRCETQSWPAWSHGNSDSWLHNTSESETCSHENSDLWLHNTFESEACSHDLPVVLHMTAHSKFVPRHDLFSGLSWSHAWTCSHAKYAQ
jgi:hypothetical protein